MSGKEKFFLHGKPVRLVLLDNFYESSSHLEIQKMFGSLLNWKIQGYKSRYETSFVPLDQADYFNRHYVFCFENQDGSLTPFSGQRYISLKRCVQYNSKLPLLNSVQASGCQKNIEFLTSHINSSLNNKRDLIYPSGYTLDFAYSGIKEFSQFGAKTTAAIHCFERLLNPESTFITASVLRFKTYRLLKMVGHQFIQSNGLELPTFQKKSAGGEELKLMSLETLSPWALESYQNLSFLFENAITFETKVELKDVA